MQHLFQPLKMLVPGRIPMGYKSGVLYKRNLNVFYYQGDGEEYDFQLFFENENIIKIINKGY
jgi:hypothetical protein